MKITKWHFLLGVMLLMSAEILAQPGNPSTPVPIGFLEVLIGGGAVYGLTKKLKERSDEKNN